MITLLVANSPEIVPLMCFNANKKQHLDEDLEKAIKIKLGEKDV